MPDVLGPLYEAVLARCLRDVGARVDVCEPRPAATCRQTCPYSIECKQLGHEPSIDVDPDVLGATSEGTPLVAFVTHWRTTGFEKKFWRTAEEILEHQTHRAGSVGISFIAEPISQSDRLRGALGVLAGSEVDMAAVWGAEIQTSVDEIEVAVVARRIPAEPTAALAPVAADRAPTSPINRYAKVVSAVLPRGPLAAASGIPVADLYSLCITSRRRSAAWNIRPVACSARTIAQLLSLVLFALDADGIGLSEDQFRRGSIVLPSTGEPHALRVLSQTPYRIAGRNRHMFVSLVDTIVGRTLKLHEQAFPTSGRTSGTLVLARAYLEYLRRDDTWAGYLERLTHGMFGPTRQSAMRTVSAEYAAQAVTDVIVDAKDGWRLDLLISAAGYSQVRLASDVDPEFCRITGSSLKSISAFGDEAKKVIAFCARNRSGELKSAKRMSKTETLRVLSQTVWGRLNPAIEWPLPIDTALFALRVRDMRTYLSGAPHPLLGAITAFLDSQHIEFHPDVQPATVVTHWHGGNTGRTEYQFKVLGGVSPLLIKVSTGQDGNEGHKWKELCGRIRGHRATGDAFEAWLVLDGEWSADAVRKLYEAGYARIFSVDEVEDLEHQIMVWLGK